MTIIGNGLVTLSSGQAYCEIAPQAGGAIANFWWERGGRRVHWLRPAMPDAIARADARHMACFPMVPYGNRIRDGRFLFCGREVVESTAGSDTRHAIHGHGWRRRWSIIERAEDRLVIEYAHSPDAWLWSYRVRQSFVLEPESLSITLDVENLSDALMPAGLGFHPYFPRSPEATLMAAVDGVWFTDAEIMPTERAGVPPGWDLAPGARIADLALDNVFTGWRDAAVITWPERRARLSLTASQPLLSFLVVYTPRSEDFFCVEPASHCTDAINLARDGVPNTGLRVLAPGARRGATMTLRPEFL